MLRDCQGGASASTASFRLMLSIALIMSCNSASAESLRDALSAAYQYNPSLEVRRAQVRASDENVSIAHGRFRPTIAGSGGLSWEKTILSGNSGGVNAGNINAGNNVVVDSSGNLTQGGVNRRATYGISISQPIFAGGQLISQLRSAEAGVRGDRELLRDTESSVLLQAVTAYVSVLSFRQVLSAQERNLRRLTKVVRVTQERVELSQLTRTDLSQAKLRRATAVAAVAAARADLREARAFYMNVIGHNPGRLSKAKILTSLPKTLAAAQATANNENPLIINALYTEEAARHGVRQIRGQLLPQVSLGANWGDEHSSSGVAFQRRIEVDGRVTIPIYSGGQIHAAVRQAKHIHVGAIQSIEQVRSAVRQSLTSAWSRLQSQRTQVQLGAARIRASQVALEGVRNEEEIGQRTLLDVLNAEQDILDARVAAILARRDLVIASYEILALVGRLDAETLGLGSRVYDPTIHYHEVRRKWFGLNITHADGREERFRAKDPEGAGKSSK